MSQAASQAAAFYRDVAETGRVWTIRDAGGFPAPVGGSGQRSQPSSGIALVHLESSFADLVFAVPLIGTMKAAYEGSLTCC